MLVMVGFMVVLGPLIVTMSIAPKEIAIVALGGVLLMYAAAHGAILTPMQLISPNRMRGRLAAVTALLYVIPSSTSPAIIGLFTDRVFEDPMALGDAMAITLGSACFFGAIAGLFAWRQAKALEARQGPGRADAKPRLVAAE
jgi:hypothetical protein